MDAETEKQERLLRDRITAFLQACIVLAVTGYATFSYQMDAALSDLWNSLKANTIIKWDTCEPFLVFWAFRFTLSFYDLFENFYPRYHLWLIPEAKLSHKRERKTISQCLLYVSHDAFLQLAYYYGPIAIFDFTFPRRKLPDSIPGLGMIALQVVSMLATYDFCFFWCHYFMHKQRTIYRWFHARHHEAGAKYHLNHWGTIALSFGQTWTNLFCSIFTVNSLKFVTGSRYSYHPLARIVYNTVTVIWLIEEHSGYDMPWMTHRLFPFLGFGGPEYHYAHHTRGHGNYQKWFTYLDSLLKTQLKRFDELDHATINTEKAPNETLNLSDKIAS
eukprot:CAMPEP_0184482548 /NCGR_PEP_ID=MMETSP0113_2-20130426/4112_1 /TAXON_ID=91329 /ORGANISM="Norrisiella sphaerica, Strain BC52" /LENGTH=330 /DNA_ID=CAMNT_0026862347 /DNA_START=198 /DNA_END=1190 /DNA_ORIENTATION=+